MRCLTRWNESELACSSTWRTRRVSSLITAMAMSGLRRKTPRKSLRESARMRVSASVFTLADRGELSSSDISPKKEPGPNSSRIFSRPSPESLVTFTWPSRITYM